jgi:hypothetical protein
MSVKRALVLLPVIGMLLAVTASSASAAAPLTITKFTMEPTEPTVIKGAPNDEFINEPYKTPFTQAGGHPWGLTTTIEFQARGSAHPGYEEELLPTQEPKDIVTTLPPGLLGNPQALPRCPLTQVTSGGALCPADTQVGVYLIHKPGELLGPIINVTPEAGQSAEFALENTLHIDTPLLTAHLVRTAQGVAGCTTPGGCYGFTVVSNSIPDVGIYGVELTFWGVPGDPSHDPMRGLICKKPGAFSNPLGCPGVGEAGGGGESYGYSPVVPFLTLGTDCGTGLEGATVRVDSWEEPGVVGIDGQYGERWTERTTSVPAVTGCESLRFDPSVGVEPDTSLADEPVGLGVNVNVPLNESPTAPATPQLRNTVLTLPEGMSVSPGVVDGIRACEAEGPEGINIEGPESEVLAANGEWHLAPGHCPDASVVGTAEAITPFLPTPVKGHVYLAKPGCGGQGQAACTDEDAADGNLYKLYLELGGEGELADTGIEFKVPLETEANPATGQLTTRTLDTPQAPFSELKIHLNGGPRAPIDNPAVCGAAVTTSDFTPWSAPGLTPEGLAVAGTPDATPSSFFNVEGCSSPAPFAPGFVAGTVTPQAGQFSAFTMNISRGDREQYVKGIQLHTPPGLLAMLSSVPLCPENQANDPSVYGECPPSSKIGTTRVASGAGSHPFEIEGDVYLTGPHDGAPFGLSIVTHAVAGPFNLGLVVVRARIDIDRENSTATITTDETGPYAVPQIVFGVPLRLQRITVDIDRPGFMFNPTSCNAQQITATISGSQNATASVSSPFAVGGCKSLEFKPKFAVSTSGKTSKADGASLDAKLSYPAGSVGSEANIAQVKVDLPKQLPSRLTTLQKACTAQTFEANPANCPAASIVGIVRADTPLLPVGLSGPVYFVSHGGEAFPSLIVVLQGDGVRVDLTGSTFISHAGITSSTFKTVPDVPVNTFEIYLPEGKYSALAANGSLCASQGKLKMPTLFVAQNGAEIHETTPVTVSGCAKTPKKVKAKAKHKGKRVRAKRAVNTSRGRTGR